ncbi:hypothetical protein [Geodermatophilus sp. URMC 64]
MEIVEVGWPAGVGNLQRQLPISARVATFDTEVSLCLRSAGSFAPVTSGSTGIEVATMDAENVATGG